MIGYRIGALLLTVMTLAVPTAGHPFAASDAQTPARRGDATELPPGHCVMQVLEAVNAPPMVLLGQTVDISLHVQADCGPRLDQYDIAFIVAATSEYEADDWAHAAWSFVRDEGEEGSGIRFAAAQAAGTAQLLCGFDTDPQEILGCLFRASGTPTSRLVEALRLTAAEFERAWEGGRSATRMGIAILMTSTRPLDCSMVREQLSRLEDMGVLVATICDGEACAR